MGFIYKITNQINQKIYIGKTAFSIQKRFQQHKKKAFSDEYNRHLYNAIKKYSIQNFTIEKIQECDNSILDQREKYWISFFNSTNPKKGYNMTLGGQGGNTWILNPHKIQTGEKIRASYLQDKYIPITKENLQNDLKNNLSYSDMMQKYHCSSVTLAKRFRYFFNGKSLKEIRPVKNSGQFVPLNISKQDFLKDIKEGFLTNKEIQEKYNIGEGTLFNKCKELTGLTPNKYRGKNMVKQGAPKININKENLLQQIKQNKNLEQIANYFNVSKETIRRRILEYFNSNITQLRGKYVKQR